MRQVASILTLTCFLTSQLYAQTSPTASSAPTASAASPNTQTVANLTPPIPWRQNVFSIPFQVAQGASGPNAPAEVQLYLSTDHGQSWRLAKRVPPKEGKFTFRAASDGEYWFGMRTVGANGLFLDNQPLTPGLRVMVDTIAPTLEVRGNRGKAGEVELHWQIADPALDARTLKLEYQGAHDAAWRPLSIGGMQPGPLPGSAVGSASFWNGQGVGIVSIRAEVSDIAGNRTVTQTKIALDEPAADASVAKAPNATPTNPVVPQDPTGYQNPPAQQQSPQFNQQQSSSAGLANQSQNPFQQTQNPFQQRPSANPNQTSGLPNWQNASTPVNPSNPAGNQPAAPGYSGGPTGIPFTGAENPANASAANGDDVFLSQPPTAQPWPADRVAQAPLEKSGPLSAQGERYFSQRPPGADEQGAFGYQPPVQQNYPQQTYPNSPYQNVSQPRESTPTYPITNTPSPLPFELPRGAKLRMVNSSSFELQYDVSAVEAGSIAKVELWGTLDGGKSWSLFGEDLDKQSPVPADVKRDGIYGFSIVVHANNGKSSPTPQPGANPEVWVGVDQTLPNGILLAAESGENDINIRWTSTDAFPAAKPVTLSYSATPNGPWTAISTAQAEQGAYTWQPGREVPELVFIQLQVTDEAGNISTTVSQQNVALPHHRPQGRILNVQPAPPRDPSAARSDGALK